MRFLTQVTVSTWAKISLLNLFLVAFLGIIMRLKFIVAMPFIQLKNLQHAHSHFAFAGWVSHMLMLLLVVVTFRLHKNDTIPRHQNRILWANLTCSFGMLFSFIYQGYGVISILCSTTSILVSYCFAVTFWKDMREQHLDRRIARWFRMALVFLVISSVGTFYLAYIMSSHQLEVKRQLSAIYFYLHFQYNGWFFFAIMGLVSHVLSRPAIILQRATNRLFHTLSVVTVPLYLLSILWVKINTLTYLAITILVLVQLSIWIYWIIQLHASTTRDKIRGVHPYLKVVFSLISVAVLLKFCLQALSVIPSLSDYVYGFRPVIIAYLHLVLLVVVSVFLIGYSYHRTLLSFNRSMRRYFTVFISGVVLNELLLALQASLALINIGLPYAYHFLLMASIVIGIGLIGMLTTEFKTSEINKSYLT